MFSLITPIPVSNTGQALTFPHQGGRDFTMVRLHVFMLLQASRSFDYQPIKPSTFVVTLRQAPFDRLRTNHERAALRQAPFDRLRTNHERAALRQAQGEREQWFREITERPCCKP